MKQLAPKTSEVDREFKGVNRAPQHILERHVKHTKRTSKLCRRHLKLRNFTRALQLPPPSFTQRQSCIFPYTPLQCVSHIPPRQESTQENGPRTNTDQETQQEPGNPKNPTRTQCDIQCNARSPQPNTNFLVTGQTIWRTSQTNRTPQIDLATTARLQQTRNGKK